MNDLPDKPRCYSCGLFKVSEEFLYLDYVRICSSCLTVYDVGYIAGFFDGEGHVELPPKYHRSGGGIRFSQADSTPLRYILERFPGGLLYHTDNTHRGIYELVYNGTIALPICNVMKSHLIVKYAETIAYLSLYKDIAVESLAFEPLQQQEPERPSISWPITPRNHDTD